jgi:lipopolysaccharide export system protein LptA
MLKSARIKGVFLLLVIPAVVSGDPILDSQVHGNDGKKEPVGQSTPAPSAEDATITSDQMELFDNGTKTVFTGHVVLERSPYVMTADRMTRYQATGIVEAENHVVGTWIKPTGEMTKAVGGRARYDPQAQTTDLWETPSLTHWDTAKDPTPLVVTAERFIAHHDTQMLFAKEDVTIRRGTVFQTHSDQAQFDQKMQVIHLWGSHKTAIQWEDAQGSGHFLSERALLYLSPKRARLMDNVTGHVIPSPR